MTDKNITKKEKAIELLKQMDIYAPYIRGFREKGMVCFFERFGGYWADQEPELYEKMKAIEKKYNCVRRVLFLPHRDGLSKRMGDARTQQGQYAYRLRLRLEQRRRLVQRVRQRHGAELRRRDQKDRITRRNNNETI